jgi:hypothetical protein
VANAVRLILIGNFSVAEYVDCSHRGDGLWLPSCMIYYQPYSEFDEDAWFYEGYQYAVTDGVKAAAGSIVNRETPHQQPLLALSGPRTRSMTYILNSAKNSHSNVLNMGALQRASLYTLL